MDRYTVLSVLDHDQVRYAAGDVVELAPEHAEPLLACGCIAPAPADDLATDPAPTEAAPAKRQRK